MPFYRPGKIINSFLSKPTDAQLHEILKEMKKKDSLRKQSDKLTRSIQRQAFIESALKHDHCPYTDVPKNVREALMMPKNHTYSINLPPTTS